MAWLATFLLLTWNGAALAAGSIDCFSTQLPFATITFNLSDYNATSVGNVIAPTYAQVNTSNSKYGCTFSGHGPGTFRFGWTDYYQIPNPRNTVFPNVSFGGYNHYVYTLPGISGIGYIIATDTFNGKAVNVDSPAPFVPFRQYVTNNTVSSDPQTLNDILWYATRINLVKLTNAPLTGPFPVNTTQTIASTRYDIFLTTQGQGNKTPPNPNFPTVSKTTLPTLVYSLNIQIIDDLPRSCTTPSVPTVILPMVNAGEFTGMGDTRGETPFTIKFTNCTDNLAWIGYKFTPSTSVPSPNPALGLLGNTGTATGVAVQVVHNNQTRTPHPLNVDATLTNPATGQPVDSDFDFNLIARYYQTAAAPPTAGSVKAVMLVHLVYH